MTENVLNDFQAKMTSFRSRFDEIAQEAAKQQELEPLSKDTLDWLWRSFVAEFYLHTRKR